MTGVTLMTLGSATIYGSPVAEIADGAEMKQLVGICPQFNIIFDVLTVEEHLKIFAAIKGIMPCDIDNEVSMHTLYGKKHVATKPITPICAFCTPYSSPPILYSLPHCKGWSSTDLGQF